MPGSPPWIGHIDTGASVVQFDETLRPEQPTRTKSGITDVIDNIGAAVMIIEFLAKAEPILARVCR
jgi:hypothetical protein